MNTSVPAAQRLFFAFLPPPAPIQHLSQALEALRSDSEIRMVPSGRWHVTLAFLGDVEEGGHGTLQVAAREVAQATNSQPLCLMGGGHFGSALWVGLSPSAWLSELNSELNDLATHRISGFTPHLTFGRALKSDRDLTPLDGYRGSTWVPERMALIHSTLGEEPTYSTLAEFDFADWPPQVLPCEARATPSPRRDQWSEHGDGSGPEARPLVRPLDSNRSPHPPPSQSVQPHHSGRPPTHPKTGRTTHPMRCSGRARRFAPTAMGRHRRAGPRTTPTASPVHQRQVVTRVWESS